MKPKPRKPIRPEEPADIASASLSDRLAWWAWTDPEHVNHSPVALILEARAVRGLGARTIPDRITARNVPLPKENE